MASRRVLSKPWPWATGLLARPRAAPGANMARVIPFEPAVGELEWGPPRAVGGKPTQGNRRCGHGSQTELC